MEILDYDKNMNAMVFNLEKRNVGLSTENLLPYSQVVAEVVDTVNISLNQLLVLLEKRKSELYTYANIHYGHNQAPGGQGEKLALAERMGDIEDIMKLYNTAVEPYNSMKITQTTKSQL